MCFEQWNAKKMYRSMEGESVSNDRTIEGEGVKNGARCQ